MQCSVVTSYEVEVNKALKTAYLHYKLWVKEILNPVCLAATELGWSLFVRRVINIAAQEDNKEDNMYYTGSDYCDLA